MREREREEMERHTERGNIRQIKKRNFPFFLLPCLLPCISIALHFAPLCLDKIIAAIHQKSSAVSGESVIGNYDKLIKSDCSGFLRSNTATQTFKPRTGPMLYRSLQNLCCAIRISLAMCNHIVQNQETNQLDMVMQLLNEDGLRTG